MSREVNLRNRIDGSSRMIVKHLQRLEQYRKCRDPFSRYSKSFVPSTLMEVERLARRVWRHANDLLTLTDRAE